MKVREMAHVLASDERPPDVLLEVFLGAQLLDVARALDLAVLTRHACGLSSVRPGARSGGEAEVSPPGTFLLSRRG